jgi:hypothetical protein
MCKLSVDYNGNSLQGGEIKLEGGQVILIPMKRVYVGMLVGAGMDHMSNSHMVQVLPFLDPLMTFLCPLVNTEVLGPRCVAVEVEGV